MCRFFSAIVMRPINNARPEIFWHWTTDSHEEILAIHNIGDADNHLCERFALVEFVPGEDWLNLDDYALSVDASAEPHW